MNIIETHQLSKTYKSAFKKNNIVALTDLNLKIEEGIIFGLLGPNGAGKTTLIKLLLGITYPTNGTASIFGKDLSDYSIKKKIGYLPENHRYPSYLTGKQVLYFFGKLSGMENGELKKRIEELLETVNLSKWKNKKVKTYSKGMMQRLGLAQALINDPELIFLDEPTDGVDPIGRKEIRDILINLKNQSKTVFLNSHLLSEVEMITDRVAILNNGKLIKEGTIKELTEKQKEYMIKLSEKISKESLPSDMEGIKIKSFDENSILLSVIDKSLLNNYLDKLRSNNIIIEEIVPVKNSLEDVFISLIKNSESGGNNE